METDDLATPSSSVKMKSDEVSTSKDIKPDLSAFSTFEDNKINLSTSGDIKPNVVTFAFDEDLKPDVSTVVSTSKDIQPDVSTIVFSEDRKESRLEEMLQFSKDNYQKCDVCHKEVSDLSTHKKVHSEDKLHECNVCLKRFAKNIYLIKHKKIHEEDHPLVCDVCHRRFIVRYHLIRHQMSSAKNQLECDCCHKRFSCRSTLVINNHSTSEDIQPKLSTIPSSEDLITDKDIKERLKFSKNNYQERSTLTSNHSKGPFECKICHLMFARKIHFLRHKNVHRHRNFNRKFLPYYKVLYKYI